MASAKYYVSLRVAHPAAAALAKSKGYEAVDPDIIKKVPLILTQKELDDLRAEEPWAIVEPIREAKDDGSDERAVEGKKAASKKRASTAKRAKKASTGDDSE